MLWCLISLTIISALLGLAALTMRVPRPELTRTTPGRVARGCLAILCLLIALGLLGVTLALAFG
jgi:hypothetical protein